MVVQLNYNRGSLIPLCMRLASADPAALDALCAPNAIVVRLQRRGALASVSAANKKSGVVGLRLPVALGGDDGQSLEEGPAAWTAVRHEQNGGEHVRYLAGELGVPRGVKPSSTKIEVRMGMYLGGTDTNVLSSTLWCSTSFPLPTSVLSAEGRT